MEVTGYDAPAPKMDYPGAITPLLSPGGWTPACAAAEPGQLFGFNIRKKKKAKQP